MFYARAIFTNSHEAITAKFYTKADRDAFVAEKSDYIAINAADARREAEGRVNHVVLFTGKSNGRWYRA